MNYSKRLLITILFCVLGCSYTFTIKGQNRGDFCAQPDIHQQRMATDSTYLDRHQIAQEMIRQKVVKMKSQQPNYEQYQQNTNCPGGPDIYTLPVVFHIVHNNGSANIPDSSVVNAVDNLNKAFRNTGAYNPDTGADVRFEYCLASRDTNGNATNGITRTVSSQYTNLNKDNEDQALKNLVRWNTTQYINVWVVKEICDNSNCNTAGYAYRAGAHGQPYDGIVVEASYVNENIDDVKILIHEMGHYFDLLHPFEGGCTNNNCTQDGDKICDTPPDDATYELSNCSNTYNSCSTDAVAPNSPFSTDVPDNHRLYMDYSLAQCQNQFSQGQKDRMVAALKGPRQSLLESQGCVPVTSRDAALAEIKYPVDRACNPSFQPVVTLLNRGTNTLTSADISISIDQTQQVNDNWSGNLATDNSVDITLPQVSVTQGSHTLTAVVANANGAGNPDGYSANDTLCTSFSLVSSEDSVCQDFESTAILPAKWSVENSTNDYTWTDTSLNCHGTSLYLDAFGKYVQQDTFNDKLKLPLIDLTNYSSAQLTFDYAYKRTYTNRSTIFEVYASANCGLQNDTLFSKTGSNLATTLGFDTTEWAPANCNQWATETVDLSAYLGSNVQLAFNNIIPEYYGQNIYIDNICLQGTPCTTSVDVGGDTSICDTSYTIDAGGGYDSYQWSTGDTTQTITVDSYGTGSYQVTVTEGVCKASDSLQLQLSPQVEIQLDSLINVNCAGDTSGAIYTSTASGLSTLDYQWSIGDTTDDLENVAASSYSVTVASNAGCADTASYIVQEPSPLQASVSSVTNVTCYGQCNGQASISVIGGTSPYTYNWSGGNTPTGSSNNGLCAGNYDVTVTDANDCDTIVSVTITAPPPLTSSITDTINVNCHGSCNGFAVVTPSGGTPPYTYNWSGGLTPTDSIATGLCAGSYGVTVTDGNGCTRTDSVIITEPSILSANVTDTGDVSCNGVCDGSATVTPSGGTTPYSYSWDNGSTDSTASGLCAGIHQVTVTDANNCDTVLNITISEPTELTSSITDTTHVSCNGGCDASATVTPSGGTAPYSYQWSSGMTPNDSINTGLCAGTVYVTVEDAHQCQSIDTLVINEPAPLDLQLNGTDPACYGDSNGAVDLIVNGGTSSYDYAWSSGDSTQDLSNRTAGTYTVTVTDSNQCSETTSVTIQQPSPLDITLSTYSTECDTPTGRVAADVTGGNGDYSFSWSTGETVDSIAGKAAGNYSLTVTDSTGCQATDAALVQAIGAPTVSGKSTKPVSCFGGQDGEASVIVNGGAPPYSFNWSGGQTDSIATGLSAGAHTVTITDDSSCATIATVQIGQPSAISVQRIADTLTCEGGSDGAIAVAVSGGTPGYNYQWSTGGTDSTLIGLPAGSYTLTVTDANNCTKVDTVPVYDPPQPLTIDSILTDDPSCYQGSDGSISVVAKPYSQSISYSYNSGTSFISDSQQTSLSAGTHPVIIQNQKGCTAMDTATLDNPAPVSVELGSDTSGCDQIILQAQGASGSYNWNTGDNGQTIIAQNSGSYIVTVTDNNGCTASDTVDVTIHSSPVVALADTTACDSAELSVASGYQSYTWSNGDQGSTTTISASGTYWVDVVNAEGCSSSDTSQVTIEQPPEAGFEVSTNGLTVTLTDTSKASQSYWWAFGDDSATTGSVAQHKYDTAGTYIITQAVANNCGTDTSRNKIELINTDIVEKTALSEVNVYPNPNRGKLIVDMGKRGQDVSIRIVNSLGQTVDKQTWGDVQNERTLDLPDDNNHQGVYWLHITSNKKTIIKKVICLDK